jgi:hypothetical protein
MTDGPYAVQSHSAHPFPKATPAASGRLHQKSPPGSQLRTSISFLRLPVEGAVEPTMRPARTGEEHALDDE